jgi:hypothetical protein
MEYKRIVAVTGLPGLFEIVSSKSDGAIVRSLDDNSTKFISSRMHNLSHLESIEIFTVHDNVNLTEIFNAIKNSNAPLPDIKDNKQLKAYFEQVYPDMDFERVYTSDMKKMIKWYEALQKHGVEFTLSDQEGEESNAQLKEDTSEQQSSGSAETNAIEQTEPLK